MRKTVEDSRALGEAGARTLVLGCARGGGRAPRSRAEWGWRDALERAVLVARWVAGAARSHELQKKTRICCWVLVRVARAEVCRAARAGRAQMGRAQAGCGLGLALLLVLVRRGRRPLVWSLDAANGDGRRPGQDLKKKCWSLGKYNLGCN